MTETGKLYNVIRLYKGQDGMTRRRRIILAAVTLQDAQRHCHDPNTSSHTATSPAARARTRKIGRWFDGYEAR